MRADASFDIPLAVGESLHLHVACGTVLLLAQGRVQIDEAPRWLAERVVTVRRSVEQGQPCAVEQTGWVRVTALGRAGARLCAMPAAPARPSSPWWRLVPGLRRH